MENIQLPFKNLDNWKDMPIPPARDDEYAEKAWGIEKCGQNFKQLDIVRPKVRELDVKVDVHWCGICHTDVHIGLN